MMGMRLLLARADASTGYVPRQLVCACCYPWTQLSHMIAILTGNSLHDLGNIVNYKLSYLLQVAVAARYQNLGSNGGDGHALNSPPVEVEVGVQPVLH